ncbi:unnamed protein product [Closterium sp. NIES-53]
MASWKSTGTYVNAVPSFGANIVDGKWIFRVKRPPGSPPAFKARYNARGFSQRQGVDYFQTFSPTLKMTTLRVLLHVAAQRDYELHSLDFSTAFLPESLHEEIWLCRPPGFTGSFPRVPFQPPGSLRGSRTSGMGLVLGVRGPVVLTGHADASWVDDSTTQRSSHGYTFSLGSGSVSWRSTRSSSVLSSSREAEIYAGAMAAQELRWLTYLLRNLGEQPRSPPVLYVDIKAMIALCQEHRLEHRMKHIALRYFLARELQHRGQLRLAYVATRANTADIFTKALPPACFAFLDWSCDHLFSPTLPMGAPQPRHSAPWPFDLSAPAATATAATIAATPTAAPLLLLLLELLLLLPSLSQPLQPRTPPSLPAMTSLRHSGGSGHGGGGSSGSGDGRRSNRCGAVRWGVSGGGQMRVQERQDEALTPVIV